MPTAGETSIHDGATAGDPDDSALFRAVFDASPDGILIAARDGTIRRTNGRLETMFGYEPGELEGRSVELLVPDELRESHSAHRRRYVEDPEPRPMGVGLELRGRRADGTTVPVEISLSPLSTDEGPLVIATVRDMTARRRLREFGAGALRAAEEERRRISRELHDDTAQRLAALLLRLRLARGEDDPERRRRMLDELHHEIRTAAESVRRIARGLRPPALEDAGVVTAIRGHLRAALEGTGIRGEVEADPVDPLLDDYGKLVLYRVVQEAVSNAIRHSAAGAVRIRIGRSEDGVVARVADDGRGFVAGGVARDGGGLGLLGMQERAALAGGRVVVVSAPGEGTEVSVELPSTAPSTGSREVGR